MWMLMFAKQFVSATLTWSARPARRCFARGFGQPPPRGFRRVSKIAANRSGLQLCLPEISLDNAGYKACGSLR